METNVHRMFVESNLTNVLFDQRDSVLRLEESPSDLQTVLVQCESIYCIFGIFIVFVSRQCCSVTEWDPLTLISTDLSPQRGEEGWGGVMGAVLSLVGSVFVLSCISAEGIEDRSLTEELKRFCGNEGIIFVSGGRREAESCEWEEIICSLRRHLRKHCSLCCLTFSTFIHNV